VENKLNIYGDISPHFLIDEYDLSDIEGGIEK